MAELALLLVDDELDFIEPLSARLARRGVACTVVTSGEDALVQAEASRFDCAVVDVKMPGMDGLELLRRLRRDHPSLPVVLLTGHASVELGVEGMELGAFDYLLKPIDLDELLDIVRRASRGQ
jgi:DNA-binding response OmpR family regulator